MRSVGGMMGWIGAWPCGIWGVGGREGPVWVLEVRSAAGGGFGGSELWDMVK